MKQESATPVSASNSTVGTSVAVGASAEVIVKVEEQPNIPASADANAAIPSTATSVSAVLEVTTAGETTPMKVDSCDIGERGDAFRNGNDNVAPSVTDPTVQTTVASNKSTNNNVGVEVELEVKSEMTIKEVQNAQQQEQVGVTTGEARSQKKPQHQHQPRNQHQHQQLKQEQQMQQDRAALGEDEDDDDLDNDNDYDGYYAKEQYTMRETGGGGGTHRRPDPLPLRPTSLHPAFSGRRPLPRVESPASGRSYGLWNPEAVHPAFFGHLRHGGEAAGGAGLTGWTGAGDGGGIDRALRVLRGLEEERRKEDYGMKWTGGMGVVTWSAEHRATVLGLLCEEASTTGTALEHMEVRGRELGGERRGGCIL